jgi:hypothetical protein
MSIDWAVLGYNALSWLLVALVATGAVPIITTLVVFAAIHTVAAYLLRRPPPSHGNAPQHGSTVGYTYH